MQFSVLSAQMGPRLSFVYCYSSARIKWRTLNSLSYMKKKNLQWPECNMPQNPRKMGQLLEKTAIDIGTRLTDFKLKVYHRIADYTFMPNCGHHFFLLGLEIRILQSVNSVWEKNAEKNYRFKTFLAWPMTITINKKSKNSIWKGCWVARTSTGPRNWSSQLHSNRNEMWFLLFNHFGSW